MQAFCCGVRVFSSLVVERAPEHVGSVVCGTWALELRRTSSVVVAHGLSCPAACGNLVPRPRIEPASPALEGGFFTTGQPGESLPIHVLLPFLTSSLMILVEFAIFLISFTIALPPG